MQQTLTTKNPLTQPDSVTTRDLITIPVLLIYIWTLITVGRPQDVFPVLKPLHPGDITAGLAILSFLVWGEKDQPFFSFPETKLFLVFFIVAVISGVFGYYQTASYEFVISFFLKFGLYLYLTTKLIVTKKRINGLLTTITLSGFLMAFATVLTQQPGIRAAVGSTYDPNDMALLMVITLPLAVVHVLNTQSKKWKTFYLIGITACILALVATSSRGGFLGLVAVLAFMLKIKMPGLPKKKLVFIGVLIGIIFMASAGEQYMSRISSIFEDVSDRRAGSGRMLVWERSLVLFFHNPILGVGPACFSSAYGNYLDGGKFKGDLAPKHGEWASHKWVVAHSAYLTILPELGITGFIVYLFMISRTFRNLNYRINTEEETNVSLFTTGLKISFFGFLVCAAFLSKAYNPLFYTYFFISGNIFRGIALNKIN